MKNWLTNVVLGQIMHSKKFIYALTGIVVPFLMTKFGWGADVAETVWQTACVLILGQGIADISKK
jgi:hypothetical protein|tara:strand:- start:1485 stop:1679 length:195 start_codon:yes stop_codon:yes gene_type:complete